MILYVFFIYTIEILRFKNHIATNTLRYDMIYIMLLYLNILTMISKYSYCFIMGFILKLYDDIVELYLVDNKRIIETIKTVFTILTFYFIVYYADNKYDILWLVFFGSFLPIVDWVAYTEDPYFFSMTLLFPPIAIATMISKNYLTNINFMYLIPSFILYCVCSPVTEILCFDFNGPLRDIFKAIGILPDNPDVSYGDLEVSFKKLITRIVSFVFLWIMILIMGYVKRNTDDQELSQMLSSVILFSLFNNGYFLLSIINQYYSIYINPEIMKKHHNKEKIENSPVTPIEAKEETETVTKSSKSEIEPEPLKMKK